MQENRDEHLFHCLDDWKGLLTHSLERGVLVEILAGLLLLVRAGELPYVWIRLRNQARRLCHVVHVVDI